MEAVEANFRAGGIEGRPKATDLWRTPPDFFQQLNAEFCFALDAACTSENCLAPAGLFHDKGINALTEDWALLGGGEPIWLNPPYSNVAPWLKKASETHAVVVCLVTCDPSTKWWRDYVATRAAEIRFVIGRIKFRKPDGEKHETKRQGGGTTTPSAIVIYRPRHGIFAASPAYGYMAARPDLITHETK
jgi:phage N-6-adenine-methyltransferase